jgi:hypothetical protein
MMLPTYGKELILKVRGKKTHTYGLEKLIFFKYDVYNCHHLHNVSQYLIN